MRLPTTATSLPRKLGRRLVRRPSRKVARAVMGRSLHHLRSGAGGEIHARDVAVAMLEGRRSERTGGGAEGDKSVERRWAGTGRCTG